MRSIDLDSLHIFRAVVETGGITGAAMQLGRVQSNVTTRIRNLEERLGAQLFRRERNRLVLSDDGARLLVYAERLLRLADEAELALRPGGLHGILRIGALESTTAARLPPLLSQFHATYPDVRIDLSTGDTTTLLRRIRRFEIEAAFVSEPFDPTDLDSVIAFDERLALISPLSQPEIITVDDLRKRTIIAFETGCSYRRILEDWLAAARITPERFLELASYHAIFACVVAGTGIGIMPHAVLDAMRASGRVRIRDLPPEIGHVRTHLVWPQGHDNGVLGAMRGILARLQDTKQVPG